MLDNDVACKLSTVQDTRASDAACSGMLLTPEQMILRGLRMCQAILLSNVEGSKAEFWGVCNSTRCNRPQVQPQGLQVQPILQTQCYWVYLSIDAFQVSLPLQYTPQINHPQNTIRVNYV